MAGYSGTPLAKKLGIVEQPRLIVLSAPWNYERTLGLPAGKYEYPSRLRRQELFVHLFISQTRGLRQLGSINAMLADTGMLWVSWPKKASQIQTDVTEELVRQAGLRAGLVDVKVCAVDEVWSGLKFVRRIRDRAAGR